MTETSATHLLVGYADPVGQGLGFLLPIFSRPQHNARQVETWGSDLTVEGFADVVFEGALLAPPNQTTWSRVGGAAHWAFSLAGEIVHGAGAEGQDVLAALLDGGDLDEHPLLALEVAEFLERRDERLRRAATAYRRLRDRSWESAARWRDLSILTPDFRARLIAAFGREPPKQLIPALGRVTVVVRDDVVEVVGIDIEHHPMDVGPIVDALQVTMNELTPLYGERSWKFTFRRVRAPSAPPWPGHDLDHLKALVYVADTQAQHRVQETRSVVDGVGLYGPSDNEIFIRQTHAFDGPAFALYALDRWRLPRLPHATDVPILGLATRVKATARLHHSERDALELTDLQTILVPSREQAAWRPKAGLAGELRDAVRFTSDKSLGLWRKLRVKNYVFLRANGVGPAPYDDAWTQIYGRLWKLGMIEAHGFRYQSRDIDDRYAMPPPRGRGVGVHRTAPQDIGLVGQLFPLMDEVEAFPTDGSPPVGFDVAVLAEATETSEGDLIQRHVDVVDALLHMQGWRPASTGRPSRYEDRHRRYQGGHGEMEVTFPSQRMGARGFVQPNSPEIGTIQEPLRVLAHEEAGPLAVLACLMEQGAVLASLRDLSHFHARIGGVWPLLASQMRRFCSSLPARSRSEYFAMFVRTALRTGRVEGERELIDDIADALGNPAFGHAIHLFCSSIQYKDAEAIASMRIAPHGPMRGPTYRFHVAVRPDGPWLIG